MVTYCLSRFHFNQESTITPIKTIYCSTSQGNSVLNVSQPSNDEELKQSEKKQSNRSVLNTMNKLISIRNLINLEKNKTKEVNYNKLKKLYVNKAIKTASSYTNLKRRVMHDQSKTTIYVNGLSPSHTVQMISSKKYGIIYSDSRVEFMMAELYCLISTAERNCQKSTPPTESNSNGLEEVDVTMSPVANQSNSCNYENPCSTSASKKFSELLEVDHVTMSPDPSYSCRYEALCSTCAHTKGGCMMSSVERSKKYGKWCIYSYNLFPFLTSIEYCACNFSYHCIDS
jgi:hypothetical protein